MNLHFAKSNGMKTLICCLCSYVDDEEKGKMFSKSLKIFEISNILKSFITQISPQTHGFMINCIFISFYLWILASQWIYQYRQSIFPHFFYNNLTICVGMNDNNFKIYDSISTHTRH